MSKVTVLDNDFATLWYYPEKKIVHHYFKKYVFDDHFREVLNQGYEYFKKQGAVKWLSDDRHNSALIPEDNVWATQDWAPRVIKAGWKYWAVVLPDKKLGQMNMKKYIDQYSQLGVVVKIFNDSAEALKWLEQQ